MSPTAGGSRGMELDDFIRAYEAAWNSGELVDLKEFLPVPGDPLYGPVLREVVRVDIELHWARGQPRPLEDYRSSFPELFSDRESLQAIAFEEYRLRRQLGENVTAAEYEDRFGVDATNWPSLQSAGVDGDSGGAARSPARPEAIDGRPGPALFAVAGLAHKAWSRDRGAPDHAAGTPPRECVEGSSARVGVFGERHQPQPGVAKPPAKAGTAMPGVGSEFLGFHLLAELGSGTFGRVYLARQEELADRLVVLKIAPHLVDEPRMLAQLQHGHIVPIYSLHQAATFQAVCMPFLGTTTLADVLTDLRRLPALPDSGKYVLDRIKARAHSRIGACGEPRAELRELGPSDARPTLESPTYVDEVLRLAVRLADGLAHAHGRGIVHRDLKPANILLTDDGQPLLLDFNLSEDTKLDARARAARVGGTLRYMAPEQLDAFRTGTRPGDERSDLYSFGLILHELLTGRHPFAELYGPLAGVLRDRRAERRPPPKLRRWNPAVSLGTESIVRHCLEPEPCRRYQTARELHEDLRRQSEHLPLKYAAEPSLVECARKWTRRHPRLSSSMGVGAVAVVLILALAGALLFHAGRLAQLKVEQDRSTAVAARQRLHEDLKTIEFLLGSDIPDAEHDQREEGMALARASLDRYRVLESLRWQDTPLVSALAPEQREQIREDMGELLLLLAGAVAQQAQLDLALRLNDLAAGCYPAGAVPQAIWRQRAELALSAGRPDLAQRLAREAEAASAHSPRDRYLLLLTEYRRRGRPLEALPWLKEASRLQRDSFSVWLILGNCYAGLGKRTDALECYNMAGALWPEAHWPSMCRGLAYLEQGNYREAVAGFDEVIRLRPETSQAYYNRALAKYRLGDLDGARVDLTHLLSEPNPQVRGYFLRAKIRARQGDQDGARRDQAEGLRGEARDERDLTARGLVRQPRDPRAALADYESALKLNPRYRTALQNKANVLAEELGRTEEAVAALDTLLSLYPDYVPALAGRGVLHARLGHREAAHADARRVLPMDTKPFNAYQVAGIYALTSRQNPDDRREALRLLESALNRNVGMDLLDRDRDLDAIRDQADFRRLVETARARRTRGAPRATTRGGPPSSNVGRPGSAEDTFPHAGEPAHGVYPRR